MRKQIANWGNYPVIESNEESFAFQEQLQELLSMNEPFIARGNGRCYGDASLANTTISTLKFDKILSFDKKTGIFECQSGLMLDQILEVAVPCGWFLPGSFSNHLLEMDIVLVSGKTITCSLEINHDLFEATCGGMGLTGIISRVKFQLKKIETSYIRQKQIKAANLEELIKLFDEYRGYTYSVAWIDCLKKGPYFGRSILILGEHAGLEDLDEKRRRDPLRLPQKKHINFPVNLPSWVLNVYTVKTFNFFYYSKNFKKEINNIIGYEPFFYPLDVILHWNRGYGKNGFVQYQFVLPLEAKNGLVEILNRISNKGLGSFLAVLKIFGKQESIISFPREGYTLALDFPVKAGLLEFLDELDQIVLQYGGRLYLSKDARMKPEMLQHGYPDLKKFKDIVMKYNPDGKIHSILSDRLFLTTN
jgi:decaprenylphospho-beta-D-ribofuranose 2-oxidase